MGTKKIFHGGCLTCTMQTKHGVWFCTGCQYFDANWSKPDLSHRPDEEKDNFIRVKAVINYNTMKYLANRNLLIITCIILIVILTIIN